MPSNASTVGPVQFPVPAGGVDTPLRDPVATTLLQLAAHWLNWGLSAKLLNMKPTESEAVPTDDDDVPTNLGEFDPGTGFVRRALPHLYCWCERDATEPWSMVKELRSAEYHMRYYFKPLTSPQGRGSRSGLLPDVSRLLHRMSEEKAHMSFPSTNVAAVLAAVGVTVGLGCSVEQALCLRELKLIRSIVGTTWEEPGQQGGSTSINRNLGGANDGAVQRGFPTLHCVWAVKEFLSDNTYDQPDDETPDLLLTINATTGEGEGYVHIMDRNLSAPDGAAPNQKDEID